MGINAGQSVQRLWDKWVSGIKMKLLTPWNLLQCGQSASY